LAGTSTLIACLIGAQPFWWWLAAAITLKTARPLGRSITALRKGDISIDLLDVAATFAALATGRHITAAFVIWMVGIGDMLLDISAQQARCALSILMRRKEAEIDAVTRVATGADRSGRMGIRSPT
jgi:Cu2+-exporting ATPase